MTIIPLSDQQILSIYYCPVCKHYYKEQTGPVKLSCTVLHPPGDCCHYNEVSLSKETVNKLKEVLDGHEQTETEV